MRSRMKFNLQEPAPTAPNRPVREGPSGEPGAGRKIRPPEAQDARKPPTAGAGLPADPRPAARRSATANHPSPIRILTAVPLCDGHDSAISTINLELVHSGIEVIYLGYHRSVREIVRAAIQEDVRAIGLSSYNGGHVEFFTQVRDELNARGAGHIGLFGGGGGTITHADAEILQQRGIDRIFFAGSGLSEISEHVRTRYAEPLAVAGGSGDADLVLSRRLTEAANPASPLARDAELRPANRKPRIVGITGPGGVGKTTLIDELVLRILRRDRTWRVAILSHDPSLVGNGALLGDRAAMIYSQDDRVFMRSLATRGQAGGLSAATQRSLEILTDEGAFDWIFLETVGIGQEAVPFPAGSVDRSILVMSPDYGSRLQLQKIGMIDQADLVVVNKSDRPGAQTAPSELEYRLSLNPSPSRVLGTVAKRHGDGGVNELFELLVSEPPVA